MHFRWKKLGIHPIINGDKRIWVREGVSMTKIELCRGDITDLTVDVIVNAANSSLKAGGGVDGAIHRKGGEQIARECQAIRDQIGSLPTGEAVITSAGKLQAKYIVHTVGPVWIGGRYNEPELLKNCYINSIRLAIEHGAKSIAFPNISTGAYSYPKLKAAKLVLETVRAFIAENDALEKIIFCCFDESNYRLYRDLIPQYFSNYEIMD